MIFCLFVWGFLSRLAWHGVFDVFYRDGGGPINESNRSWICCCFMWRVLYVFLTPKIEGFCRFLIRCLPIWVGASAHAHTIKFIKSY